MRTLGDPRHSVKLATLLAFLAPGMALALEPSAVPPAAVDSGEASAPRITLKSTALFLAGAATAFVGHESCHVIANLVQGNTPRIESVRFLGFVPFFTISPGIDCNRGRCTRRNGTPFGPGPRGLYLIVSAGFECQHVSDEVILTLEPKLRQREAPFRKGVVAFNTLTSIGYAVANWLSLEASAGDLHGMDEVSQVPRGVAALMIFTPAILDLGRYFFPDWRFLPWVSRASKTAIIGVTIAL